MNKPKAPESTVKSILLELVQGIEHLRANQEATAALLGSKAGITVYDAQDAMKSAMQANSLYYSNLRRRIEELSL